MLLIEYYGKQIIALKGNDAEKFLNKINHANNDKEKQLIMAKITGNFKRGNEIENESHLHFDYTTNKKMSLIQHFFRLSS